MDEHSSEAVQLTGIFLPVLLFCSIILLSFYMILNSIMLQSNYTNLQRGLGRGLVAYATSFNYEKVKKDLGEGWINSEDYDVFKVTTNQIEANKLRGKQIFLDLITQSTGIVTEDVARNTSSIYKVYTNFDKNKNIKYSILNTENPADIFTTDDPSRLVDYLKRKTGLSVNFYDNFNNEIQKVVKYYHEYGDKTFTSFTTYIGVFKEVQIQGLFGSKNFNMVQTYTLRR